MDYNTRQLVQKTIATPGSNFGALLPQFGGDENALRNAVQSLSSGGADYKPDEIAQLSQQNIMAQRAAAGGGGMDGFDPTAIANAMQGRQMDTGGPIMPTAGGASAQALANLANLPALNPNAKQPTLSPNWNPTPVSEQPQGGAAPAGSGISGFQMGAPSAAGLSTGLPPGGGLSSLSSPSMAIPQQYGGLSRMGTPAAGPLSSLYSQASARKTIPSVSRTPASIAGWR